MSTGASWGIPKHHRRSAAKAQRQLTRVQRPQASSLTNLPPVPAREGHKIVGTKSETDTLVKPGVTIVQKRVFHIDNLDVNCSPALLTDYLLANGIQVISCHSSKSWLRSREEREFATAFRVCVRADDEQKVFHPDLWAKGVFIRRWQFTKSHNGRQQ